MAPVFDPTVGGKPFNMTSLAPRQQTQPVQPAQPIQPVQPPQTNQPTYNYNPGPAAGDTSSDQALSPGAIIAIIAGVLILFGGLAWWIWLFLYQKPTKAKKKRRAARLSRHGVYSKHLDVESGSSGDWKEVGYRVYR